MNIATVYEIFERWWAKHENSSLQEFKDLSWRAFLAGYEAAELCQKTREVAAAKE